MTNLEFSAKLIQSLGQCGVEEFCLCAGARNSPLITTFEGNRQIQVYHFFEERSAAFFAMGRAQSTLKPVAVVTTSGTAVAELLPAVVESYYTSTPLIVVTADRPKNYRGTGAPQSIEHIGIFSSYVAKVFDIENFDEPLDVTFPLKGGPIHINVCFDEPLVDQEPIKIETSGKKNPVVSCWQINEDTSKYKLNELSLFCQSTKPMIIVSGISQQDQVGVIDFLKKIKAPLLIEATSGLRNHPELKDKTLLVPEKTARFLLAKGCCNSILRIGGIPTSRIWRDLELIYKNLPVFSVSNLGFTGLSRPSEMIRGICFLQGFADSINHLPFDIWKNRDLDYHKKLCQLFEKYPLSEPALINKISFHIKHKRLYLGNSMPIREWDLAARHDGPIVSEVFANRGANGIDGQVSTFLGIASPQQDNWGIVGDLTALYDLSSLWIANQIQVENIQLVIVNNRGGMIFKKMFEGDYFLNRHQLDFSYWAKMWSWNYEKWEDIPLKNEQKGRTIIELVPNEVQTTQFWQEWNSYD